MKEHEDEIESFFFFYFLSKEDISKGNVAEKIMIK